MGFITNNKKTGSFWGAVTNKLRVNPQSGSVNHFLSKTLHSRPHVNN